MTNEYAFDIKLLASVRVRAKNEREARELLARHFDCAYCNAGEWPDGRTILFEASLDGDADLYEVEENLSCTGD